MIKTKDGVADTKVASKQQQTSTAKKTSKSASRSISSDTLIKVQGYVRNWLKYREKLTDNWERDIKLFNNIRYEKGFKGVSDTFVPMTRSTIETVTAALATADMNTEFVPQDIYKYLVDNLKSGYTGFTTDSEGNQVPETEEEFLTRAIDNVLKGGVITDDSLDKLNALYDYYWDKGDWDMLVAKFIKSGLKIGNGALWMTWENNCPKLVIVPFPDFVFDPNAKDDDSGKFRGRRYLASLSDLKNEEIVDPITRETRKRYDLKGVTPETLYNEEDKTDKQMKEELLLGSTSDVDNDNTDQVEVIELRADGRQYVLVNRKYIAEDVEDPILSQAKLRGIDTKELIEFPCVTWANYEDDSLYIGESETSTFWQEQERLNDTTNQKSDAITRALLQLYRADPSLKNQSNSFSVPGATIWAQAGQFDVMPQAGVPLAAFSEENSIKNNIREVTATDQIVKGVGSNSDITATEANLQVAQSGQRIEMKVASLTRGPLKRLARLTLQYIRLFVSDPFIFPEKTNNGLRISLYNPDKYDYVYEPKVTLTLQAKAQKREEQNATVETYKLLIADPTNNLDAIKETLLPKITNLDKDEVKKIIEKDPMQAPASAPQMQPEMQMEPML